MTRSAYLFAIAIIVAGCGGGGGSTGGGSLPATPVPTATAAPTATPTPAVTAPPEPTPSPFALSTSVPAASGTLTLPLPSPAASFSGSTVITIANPPASTSVTVSYSNSPPGGVSTLTVPRKTDSIAGGATIAYTCYSSNNAITLTSAPVFNYTLPSAYFVPGASFWLAAYDGTSWNSGYAGPGVVSGTTISFTGAFVPQITSTPVCVALYSLSNLEPPPPTPSPTPAALIAAPSSLAFTSAGSGNSQTVQIIDPSGSSSITESDTCSTGTIATVVDGGGGIYEVTPLSAGSCTATFKNAAGASVGVPISVTVSQVIVQ